MAFQRRYDLPLWTNILESLLYIKTASAICYHAGWYFLIGCMDGSLNPEQLLQASGYRLPKCSPAVKRFNAVFKEILFFFFFSTLAVFLLQVIGTLFFDCRFELLTEICVVVVGFSNMQADCEYVCVDVSSSGVTRNDIFLTCMTESASQQEPLK